MSDANMSSCLICCLFKNVYTALLNMNQLNYSVTITLFLKSQHQSEGRWSLLWVSDAAVISISSSIIIISSSIVQSNITHVN